MSSAGAQRKAKAQARRTEAVKRERLNAHIAEMDRQRAAWLAMTPEERDEALERIIASMYATRPPLSDDVAPGGES